MHNRSDSLCGESNSFCCKDHQPETITNFLIVSLKLEDRNSPFPPLPSKLTTIHIQAYFTCCHRAIIQLYIFLSPQMPSNLLNFTTIPGFIQDLCLNFWTKYIQLRKFTCHFKVPASSFVTNHTNWVALAWMSDEGSQHPRQTCPLCALPSVVKIIDSTNGRKLRTSQANEFETQETAASGIFSQKQTAGALEHLIHLSLAISCPTI